MTLADEHAGMMDGLGQAQLENLRLQAPLQEVLDLQAQDVVQLHLALVQHADADEAPQQGIACGWGERERSPADLHLPSLNPPPHVGGASEVGVNSDTGPCDSCDLTKP